MIDLRCGTGSEVFELFVSKRVTESELEVLKRQFERTVADGIDPRVLCFLAEFWGFDSRDVWDDLNDWLQHLRRPARIALLAERKWIDLLDASREPPPGVEMRGFDPAHEAEARRWLAANPRDERGGSTARSRRAPPGPSGPPRGADGPADASGGRGRRRALERF